MSVAAASKYGENPRIVVVAVGFLFVVCFIIGRLFGLQIEGHRYYVEMADKRALRIVSEIALRGMIIDREGEPVAVSSPVSSIVADPKLLTETLQNDLTEFKDKCIQEGLNEDNQLVCDFIFSNANLSDEMLFTLYKQNKLEDLAALLQMNVDDLIADIEQRKNRRFYYLKRQVQPDVTEKIISLGLPGIFRNDGFNRFYPDAELLGQIVGFTDVEERGQEGIEKQYDEWLRGQKGKVKVVTSASRGRKPIAVIGEEEATIQGQELQLSIDKRIQYVMRRELAVTQNEYRAKSASAVMIDVKTGEILAMVSLPDGNPNNSEERKPELMKNRIITDVFEPGSTMKPIAIAGALDAGVISKKTYFPTNGQMNVGKGVVRDPRNYGTLDATGIIRKSSNIGMAMIAQKMPRAKYYDYMHRMGFGEPTGLRFPGEQRGIHRNPKKLDDFSYATTFFGYGISANALQVAQAYATLANHGVKVPLTLIKRDHIIEGEQVVSRQAADAVVEMMLSVVREGGTGTRANTASYTVAGKTGTARKIVNRRYSDTLHRALFAGIAPATNPRIALVVVIDEPQDKSGAGGIVAAPVFSRITENSLKLLGVLPDKINLNDAVHLKINAEQFKVDETTANNER
ncbi:MAG: penicillin-binding protein 2 [Cardiobacteriaceae bacterium]|nr:penicillin-binding protein 2 [Cardiobacteriaceae bacterium]